MLNSHCYHDNRLVLVIVIIIIIITALLLLLLSSSLFVIMIFVSDKKSRNRGFGYVQFVLQEDADKCTQISKSIGSRKLSLTFAAKKPKHLKRKALGNYSELFVYYKFVYENTQCVKENVIAIC